jgi:hypothetical protein
MPLLTLKMGPLYRYYVGGIDTVLETHFGFEFRDGSLVGDSLKDVKAGGVGD